MRVRINPKHWSLSEATFEDVTVTHKPVEVSDTVGAALLQLRRKGVALIVEAEQEAPTQEEVLLEVLHSDDEVDDEVWPEDEDDEEMI